MTRLKTTMDVWQRLGEVQSLRFVARSNNSTGWNGTGKGDVIVDRIFDNVLTYTERGTWQSDAGLTFGFSNVFRWSLTDGGERIRLEHLRFGADRPVYLLDLASNSNDANSNDANSNDANSNDANSTGSDDLPFSTAPTLSQWSSTEPHICREDLYEATLVTTEEQIQLQWTVNGPDKNEKIDYCYRSA
jgi:hypothetical protein